MLAFNELKYFNSLTNDILKILNIKVKIMPLEHRLFMDIPKDTEVLGCCHKIRNSNGEVIDHVITIDEPYIRMCYYGRQTDYSKYSDKTLIETICHEIAHLFFWEHDANHAQLTKDLYNTVIKVLKL